MKQFTFTPRHLELIKRQLVVITHEIQVFTEKDALEFYNTDYDRFDTTFGDFSIHMYCLLNANQTVIETMQVAILFKEITFIQMPLYSFRERQLHLYEVMQELYKHEHRVFKLCKIEHCNELCFSKDEDYCKQDYVYCYHHTDNCCICLENGGSWTKLTCAHFIHTACLQKVIIYAYPDFHIQCPLCKQHSLTNAIERNYLFI